jgi:hypothetical protein
MDEMINNYDIGISSVTTPKADGSLGVMFYAEVSGIGSEVSSYAARSMEEVMDQIKQDLVQAEVDSID